MNPSISTMPSLGKSMDIGVMLTLPGFLPPLPAVPAPPKPVSPLPGDVADILENVLGVLHELVCKVLDKQTPEEFRKACDEVFHPYFEVAMGLSMLISAVVPKDVLRKLGQENLTAVEDKLRERALDAFGADVQQQAIFTAWTLRRISDMCHRIDDVPLKPECEAADRELLDQFAFHSMQTRFFLDCLFKSMILRKSFHPTVLPLIVDGLRNAVNAYALARRGLDLRLPQVRPPVGAEIWDEEDEDILREAERDQIPEPV